MGGAGTLSYGTFCAGSSTVSAVNSFLCSYKCNYTTGARNGKAFCCGDGPADGGSGTCCLAGGACGTGCHEESSFGRSNTRCYSSPRTTICRTNTTSHTGGGYGRWAGWREEKGNCGRAFG